MQTLRARRFQYLVNVSRETVTLDLSLKVEVPLHRFREHIRDLEFEVDVAGVRPVEKEGR